MSESKKQKTPRQLLLEKLHGIMSEVGSIGKDKTNDFHKYKYASEHAIKVAIQPLLVKHKVLFYIETAQPTREGTLTHIECTFHFVDIETGEDLTGKFAGTGEDKLDKGTYKALTGAIKYILTSTFLIPTGDDPENEQAPKKTTAQPAREPQTAEQKPSEPVSTPSKCLKCGATGAFHAPACPNRTEQAKTLKSTEGETYP